MHVTFLAEYRRRPFVQPINDNNKAAMTSNLSAWVDDQPFQLKRQSSINDGRVVFHNL
jgi:hypothetical protein